LAAPASLASGKLSVVPSIVKSTLPELPNNFLTWNLISASKSAPLETTSKLIVPVRFVGSFALI